MIHRASPVLGALLICATAPAQGVEEKRAETELQKAMELAAKGRYRAAHAAYVRIAKKYADTGPGSIAAKRAEDTAFLGWCYLEKSGPSENRVDVVLMGDAYTLDQQDRFDKIAASVPKLFRNDKLLGEYYDYFNFIRVNLSSKDGDVDGYGREYDTALDAAIMGRNAPWVEVSSKHVREALDELPEHDGRVLVFVPADGFQGNGDENIGIVSGRSETCLFHEFGHAFAGLGDEYATYTYPRGKVVPKPNVSDTDDPSKVPWRHWLEADAPEVGIHRGGDGRLEGAWRPVAGNCAMECGAQFCRVCREAVVLSIHALVDPIESCEPAAHALSSVAPPMVADDDGGYRFEVQVLQPKTHGLDVQWWVLPAADVSWPEDAPSTPGVGAADRRARGPLPEIAAPPNEESRGSRRSIHRFRWTPEPGTEGRYRVVCRVRDSTVVAGQKWPWVLKDERGLLESERGWWIELGTGTVSR